MGSVTDDEVIAAMANYGGGFVRALAYAFRHADDVNANKLRAAFPEYWAQYTESVKIMKEKQ